MKKYILCIAIALFCSCGNSKKDWQHIISNKDYEIEELESRVSELEERVEELERENEELQGQLDDAEDIIDRAKSACIIWEDDMYMVLSVLNQY